MFHLGRILASTKAGRWLVTLIDAGWSLNRVEYADEDLQRWVESGMFTGRPAKSFPRVSADGRPIGENDHVQRDDLSAVSAANVVGHYENVRWNAAERRVEAELVLALDLPEARALDTRLRALEASRGLKSLGLSIDAEGVIDARGRASLHLCSSIDVVTTPAAGGGFHHRIAASANTRIHMDLINLLAARYPRLMEGYAGAASPALIATHWISRVRESDAARVDLAAALNRTGDGAAERLKEAAHADLVGDCTAVITTIKESVEAKPAPAPVAPATPPPSPAPKSDSPTEQALERMRESLRTENKAILDRMAATDARVAQQERAFTPTRIKAACAEAKLPADVTASILADHEGKIVSEVDAQRLAESHRKIIDLAIRSHGGSSTVEITGDRGARLSEALASMFSDKVKAPEGVDPCMGSFSAFMEKHILPSNCRLRESAFGQSSRRRIREAVDATNFDQVFADALSRSLLAEYRGNIRHSTYEKLVRQVPYSDFRTHRIINIGYYGTLPTVAKAAPYLALTTPADREETIALAKKGGLESITLEDMLNDDLQLWQSMIRRLGYASMETRFEVVMSLIRDASQPTMADSYLLTSSSRTPVNEGTAALSADGTGKTNLIASIVAMMKGTGGSGQRKGVAPEHLIIPFEKVEAAAYVINELSAGNTGSDVNQALREVLGLAIPKVFVDWGTTNATDWYLMANPSDAEVIRFATLGGRNEPEIFVADDQRFGSLFTNDVLELKIRDIFAAAAVDPLGIYGNDAAS